MLKLKKLLQSYFFLFLIILTIKFMYVRMIILNDYNLINAIWYEMGFLLFFFTLFELFLKKTKLPAYIFLNFILSLILFGVIIYEKYFGTLPSYYDLQQMDQVGSVKDSIMLLIAPKDFLLFIDFTFMLTLLSFKRFFRYPTNEKFSNRFLLTLMLISILLTSLNYTLNKNETIMDVGLFAKKHGLINTQFIQAYGQSKSIGKAKMVSTMGKDKSLTVEDLLRLKGNKPVDFEDHAYFNLAGNKNLIVLQIESLQDLAVNLEINGQEVTPNLNRLAKNNFYFTNVFQQIGAGNTSDAEFLMNTSIYPLGNRPTSNDLPSHEFTSLPRILDKHSYYSVTFHADDVTYWNRDELYPTLGFDKYYDIDYFGNKDIIGIGPSDEVLYNKTLDKLVTLSENEDYYYANLNTLTSHTPFDLPEEKETLNLPVKFDDTLVGNYLQSVHYADYAIGEFFKGLKEKGLWDDVIIAAYGDHSGLHGKLLTDDDAELLRDTLGSYSLVQRFNIPFIIAVPGEIEKGSKIDTIGGQIDMMPTVLNLMGIEPETLYFGQNLLQYDSNLIGMRYYLPKGSFFNNDILYTPETAERDIRIYDIESYGKIDNQYKTPREYYADDLKNMLQIYNWSDYYLNHGAIE